MGLLELLMVTVQEVQVVLLLGLLVVVVLEQQLVIEQKFWSGEREGEVKMKRGLAASFC